MMHCNAGLNPMAAVFLQAGTGEGDVVRIMY